MDISSHNYLTRVQKFWPIPYINVIKRHIGYTMCSTQTKMKEHKSLKTRTTL